MRFDAPEYVDVWKRTGRFPSIHAHIAQVCRETIPAGATVLDLGASTGLLSRRLTGHGFHMVAVERPGDALTLGVESGVYDGIHVLPCRVTPNTLYRLAEFINANGVEWIVARRVFPELMDALGPDQFPVLARTLAAPGVKGMIVEGRVWSPRVTHTLGSISAEVEALGAYWRLAGRRTTVAVMEPTWD